MCRRCTKKKTLGFLSCFIFLNLVESFLFLFKFTKWYLSCGSRGGGTPPHPATKFFSISRSFWGTFNKFISQHPHLRVGVPSGKILDSQLYLVCYFNIELLLNMTRVGWPLLAFLSKLFICQMTLDGHYM